MEVGPKIMGRPCVRVLFMSMLEHKVHDKWKIVVDNDSNEH